MRHTAGVQKSSFGRHQNFNEEKGVRGGGVNGSREQISAKHEKKCVHKNHERNEVNTYEAFFNGGYSQITSVFVIGDWSKTHSISN